MTIHEFPLAWRWTDPTHVELPPAELAQILPLDEATAARLHELWMPSFDHYGEVIPGRFSQIEKCSTEGIWEKDVCSRKEPNTGNVLAWLTVREPNKELQVVISWERKLAVRTNWGIFSQRWSEFCYPGSDDAFIVPDDGRWFLAFHHEDEFSFCINKNGDPLPDRRS